MAVEIQLPDLPEIAIGGERRAPARHRQPWHLRWRDALTAALLPLGYLIYALSRGAADGWYAYWFFDPARMSLPALARNTALLLALYSLIAAALILADRTLARKLPRSDPIS